MCLSLLTSWLKGRLDENREIFLYSSRPCLPTAPSPRLNNPNQISQPIPILSHSPSLSLSTTNRQSNFSYVPGTMPRIMEHHYLHLYLEPASKLDPTCLTYLILNLKLNPLSHLHQCFQFFNPPPPLPTIHLIIVIFFIVLTLWYSFYPDINIQWEFGWLPCVTCCTIVFL